MVKSDKNCYFKYKSKGNHYFKHTLCHNWIKNVTLNANAKEMITLKHTLWPNWTKTITLNTNAKEIVTLNTIYSQIRQKLLP